ncbi:Lrp/AsnC family transcriptional regulator [Paracoccus liaowanqingii]|uniref:Lrp/AsnC family transcriptional regulator n=1 Tax=Paracoccus liaowanqingii TaxID=2560053 RepID=A0A4Z1CDU9_9RHOB|nr:Lrp/AsnC family transcriptional regulator [Paracoccus liaowanqingii]QDA36603.1 Lrp/AsnC family transcriptional regulator [Paracoccus liaowanqingii]TGN47054.1 Lrp/AsnC family transcriptional regulator [Paracoccus liaowanqingii]
MTDLLDPINRRILAELLANARIPVTELARKVGLSKTPVALRIRQLEEAGLITGYRAILSPVRLGLTHVTYVEVRVSDTRQKALEAFNTAIRAVPEVEECYMIAGGFDYLLKVRSRDMADYRRIMAERISVLPHVHATSSHVAMEAVVEQGGLSLSE